MIENFTQQLQHPSQPVGQRVMDARQLIQFRLDERGAVLISESAVVGKKGHYEYKVGTRPFIFDKPFLLLLRHSVKTEPYFAAWIANSDFMVRP